jgi:acyl-homoserine-lactone acylase
VRTAQKEDKPAILARSLAAAISAGDSQLGSDHKAWQWGKLHRYEWKNANGQVVRGPRAAGGDHTTLNTSAFAWGQSFNTTLAPAMRFIVDFGQTEPLMAQNSTGQSGNPASPNYLNSIDPWLKGQYMSLPMQSQNYDKAYGTARLTLTPGK